MGSFATVVGIVNAFPNHLGMTTGPWLGPTTMAAGRSVLTGLLSQSMIPTAMGLLIAIFASCFYTYLSSKLETLDLEMQSASLDLVNQLILYRPQPNPR